MKAGIKNDQGPVYIEMDELGDNLIKGINDEISELLPKLPQLHARLYNDKAVGSRLNYDRALVEDARKRIKNHDTLRLFHLRRASQNLKHSIQYYENMDPEWILERQEREKDIFGFLTAVTYGS